MTTQIELDPFFGELTVSVDKDDSLVAVQGSAVPPATLWRRDGAKPDPYSPIGTRDGEHLVMRVAGEPARISPGRGRLSRRSYRVDVQHGDMSYRLVPSSHSTSDLMRNGARIGNLCADGEGGVAAQWQPDQRVTPMDASVGYLLAASFGTGAQNFLVTLFLALLHC
jgi:hypothetical protein